MLVIYIFRHVYPPIRERIPWQGYGLDGHLVLPVLALAVRPVFYLARVTAGLLEHELQQDYIRTARSKGLPWHGVLFRQALPPITSPVFTSIGHALRMLVSQLIIVEALFNWPGLGRMFLATLGIRTDGGPPTPFYASPETLAALAVIFSFMLLSIDLIASVLAYWCDPRLRRPGTGQ